MHLPEITPESESEYIQYDNQFELIAQTKTGLLSLVKLTVAFGQASHVTCSKDLVHEVTMLHMIKQKQKAFSVVSRYA